METVVTISEEVFQQAEELAAALGVSRNELYAKAIEYFIHQQRHENITQQLNEVYAESNSDIDAVIERLQAVSLPVERW
jgi:metal-responsive CopG/Arc/MetJ family transcriptional regulator